MGTAAQIPKAGDTVAGKYLLESMLGQGGMGAVFRARHTLTDRKVALKWMLPDDQAGAAAVQRFLREARAMGRIDHPSVVGVLDVGVEGDAAYLVMELLRGSSLRDTIEASGKLSVADAIARLLPAMEGVAAAHAAGVVHRDLKPDNLFCVAAGGSDRPTTKVLDFGVSKLQGDRFAAPGAPGSGAITHTGAMVGTPAYMAPEQVRGDKTIDARTDVWALGAILYEAISGELPFAHETLGQTIVAIATMAPPRIESQVANVPLALADAIHRALEKDLDVRWPSVEAFARAILPFAPGATFTAPRPTSVRPPAPEGGETKDRLGSAEHSGSKLPLEPSQPASPQSSARSTSASALATGDIHVSVVGATSTKTSTTSATPFVSSSAHRSLELPTNRPPWGWIAATVVVVTVAIAGVASMRGRATVPTPPAPAEPTHVASAPPIVDAGTDAASIAVVEIAPPPTSAIVAPPPTTRVEATTHARPHPRVEHAPPTTTTTTPPPTTTATGRTGHLSRDDF